MMYREHHHQGSAPYVVINQKRQSTGSQIKSNLILEEILEEGIIVRYKTHRFKMYALSSWINM